MPKTFVLDPEFYCFYLCTGIETMIKVMIIEDEMEIRNGISFLINASEGFCCKGYASAEEALTAMNYEMPDVVLMDINLTGMNGITCTQIIKEKFPSIQVMMVTAYEDDEKIFNALKAGASGYVLKKSEPSILVDSIKDILNGGSPMSSQIARKVVATFHEPQKTSDDYILLTEREKEVLNLLAEGFRNKEIADQLSLSNHTVRAHIYNIYQKLHVQSRVEAIKKINGK